MEPAIPLTVYSKRIAFPGKRLITPTNPHQCHNNEYMNEFEHEKIPPWDTLIIQSQFKKTY